MTELNADAGTMAGALKTLETLSGETIQGEAEIRATAKAGLVVELDIPTLVIAMLKVVNLLAILSRRELKRQFVDQPELKAMSVRDYLHASLGEDADKGDVNA